MELETRLTELEVELSVWKQAHSSALEASERETKAHNVQIASLNRHISAIESGGVSRLHYVCPEFKGLTS